jgi:hypothetical protein
MIGTSPNDPYRDCKIYHKAALFGTAGVSALCFRRPRAIDLTRALWTINDDAVTCPKCLRLMREAGRVDENSA